MNDKVANRDFTHINHQHQEIRSDLKIPEIFINAVTSAYANIVATIYFLKAAHENKHGIQVNQWRHENIEHPPDALRILFGGSDCNGRNFHAPVSR